MTNAPDNTSIVDDGLRLYFGNWRDQGLIYFIVFCLAVGAAVSADLGLHLPQSRVAIYSVGFTLILLCVVPITFAFIQQATFKGAFKGWPVAMSAIERRASWALYDRWRHRDFAARRLRVANNIRIRRASLTLSKANSIPEIVAGLQAVLDTEQFSFASLKVRLGSTISKEHLLGNVESPGYWLSPQTGELHWSWASSDEEWEQALISGRYWLLRMPLVGARNYWGEVELARPGTSNLMLFNTEYIFRLLEPELSQAVDRVLTRLSAAEDQSRIKLRASE